LRDTLKDWFLKLAEISFSGRQNADNLLTRSLVLAEKLLSRNLVPLKRGFHDWAKSHFQASKMKNIPTLCEVP